MHKATDLISVTGLSDAAVSALADEVLSIGIMFAQIAVQLEAAGVDNRAVLLAHAVACGGGLASVDFGHPSGDSGQRVDVIATIDKTHRAYTANCAKKAAGGAGQ